MPSWFWKQPCVAIILVSTSSPPSHSRRNRRDARKSCCRTCYSGLEYRRRICYCNMLFYGNQVDMSIRFVFSEPSTTEILRGFRVRVFVMSSSALIPFLESGCSLPAGRIQVLTSVSHSNDALFRTFVESEVTSDGIEQFICRFASPWAPIERATVDNRGHLLLFVSSGAREKKFPSNWPDQVLDLRRCVRLWDLVRACDEDRLAQHIRWQDGPGGRLSVHYDSHPDLEPGATALPPDQRTTAVIVSAETDPALFNSLSPSDVRSPALLYIEARINEHLNDQVLTQLRYDPATGISSLLSFPRNLLVGLWLQFAQAVAENKSYARCKECETWFETSIPGTRKTRMYCSDTCKVKAYMERKDRAVRLKAEGKTVKEIAHELGTDKDTVKRWLGKKK